MTAPELTHPEPVFTRHRAEYPPGRRVTFHAGLETVDELIRDAAETGIVAVDIETRGILRGTRFDLTMVGLATANHGGHALTPRDPRQAEAIRDTLRAAHTIVMHHAAFDVPGLYRHQLIDEAGIDKITDTMILARLAETRENIPVWDDDRGEWTLPRTEYALDALCEQILGVPRGPKPRGDYFARADWHEFKYLHGGIADAVGTLHIAGPLWQTVADRLHAASAALPGIVPATETGAAAVIETVQRANRVLLRRMARGIRVDTDLMARQIEARVIERERLQHTVTAAVGLDELTVGSGPAILEWVAARGELPDGWPRTATGKLSTSKEHLARLDHPIVAAFREWKAGDKTMSYAEQVEAYTDDGMLYPFLEVAKARTGRMAAKNPALQQFPGPARNMLLADAGREFTSIDWGSQEPYLAALLAHDEATLARYESGQDIYQPLADRAGITRKQAKQVVLAQLYGEGINKLAADLGVDAGAATSIRQRVLADMPGIAALVQRIKKFATSAGYVPTLAGRIVAVPQYHYRDYDTGAVDRRRLEYAAYAGVNYVVQGSAADCLYDTLVRIDEAGLADAVYLPIHDELVVDTEAAEDIRRIMETPPAALAAWTTHTGRFRTDRADLGTVWDKPE